MHEEIGVYIHWPFCISKCNYCNFNSYVKSVPDGFINTYIKQLQNFKDYFKDKKLRTVYFGGGTPSLMKTDEIKIILEKIFNSVKEIDSKIEITLEANPETLDEQKLIGFKNTGINRISLGIQSYRDNWLTLMGRKNNRAKNISIIKCVNDVFENYSVDLIYSLPYQNTWEEELVEALNLSLNAKHFSLYELSLEQGTLFDLKYKNAEYKDYIDVTHKIMLDAGFYHYEISSYARQGARSSHNMLYWEYKDYVGIGAGAHGRITLNGEKYAFEGERNLDKWISNDLVFKKLSHKEVAIEKLIMGLRTDLWCDIDEEIIDFNNLKMCTEMGFINIANNKIQTTFEGKKRLNTITEEIIKDSIL